MALKNAAHRVASFSALLLIKIVASDVGIFDVAGQNRVKSSRRPAVIKIDPPNCPACSQLDPFWNMAGQTFGESLVWRVSCAQHPEICQERPYILPDPNGRGRPALEAWDGTKFIPYSGPKNLEGLSLWIKTILLDGEVTTTVNARGEVSDSNSMPTWLPPKDAPKLMHELQMTVLHAAAFAGDLPAVRQILQDSPRPGNVVNQQNRNGATPLNLAAQAGHWHVMETLLDEFGADVDVPDREGATALRVAAMLGHTRVVSHLLQRGASIQAATQNAFLLSEVARGEGHDEIADMLENKERSDGVELLLEQHKRTLMEGNMLPEGVSIETCHLPVRMEAVKCHIDGCAEMHTQDAMDIFCDDIPCAFTPLGKMILTMTKHLAKTKPTWKLKQNRYFHSTSHLPPDVHCEIGDPACTLTMNWASGCDDNDEDIWACLFGQGEEASALRDDDDECDCNHLQVVSLREVMIALHSAILLDGNRTSPYLPKGPTPPPYNDEDGGIAVSIHVRGGDSCDLVNWSANLTSWALWPFQWSGVRGTDWNAVRRFCVHPSVHLATLRGIMATQKVNTVLLATDSTEAVELFQRNLPDGVLLKLNEYDRGPLDHRGAGHDPHEHWIEYRSARDPAFAAHAMHTALEDVRLLSRGNLLIGAMCSNFAKMVYGAMVGHNGYEVPVASVDTCEVICDPGSLDYTDGLGFNNAGV